MNIVELLNSGDIDEVLNREYWMSCYLSSETKFLKRAIINTKPILVTLEEFHGDIIHVRYKGMIKYSLHICGAVMNRNDKVKPVEYSLKLPIRYRDEIQFFNSEENAIKFYNSRVEYYANKLKRNCELMICAIESNKIVL